MRALVVDDSSTMRAILRMTLRGTGLDTCEASNGLEALERLRENGCMDVAMVDWNMPEMNGYEFLQAVRSDPQYNRMKIVMVTTETEMAQVETAVAHGANEYIMKPFTKDAVVEKLQMLGVVPQTV
jgi:two-component system chemotaxis response regulator CheY